MSVIDQAMAVKSPEEIKQEVEGTTEKTPQQNENPKMNKEYAFEFKYVDAHGKSWSGPFTNRILNYTDHSRVGAIKARLSGGVPFESLDPYTVNHNEKLAHLTISLTKRPKWAADLGELYDQKILDQLYTEVASHEAAFHGRSGDQAVGENRESDVQGTT